MDPKFENHWNRVIASWMTVPWSNAFQSMASLDICIWFCFAPQTLESHCNWATNPMFVLNLNPLSSPNLNPTLALKKLKSIPYMYWDTNVRDANLQYRDLHLTGAQLSGHNGSATGFLHHLFCRQATAEQKRTDLWMSKPPLPHVPTSAQNSVMPQSNHASIRSYICNRIPSAQGCSFARVIFFHQHSFSGGGGGKSKFCPRGIIQWSHPALCKNCKKFNCAFEKLPFWKINVCLPSVRTKGCYLFQKNMAQQICRFLKLPFLDCITTY